MYEGLDIITNKISLDERKGVRHHLLSCTGLDDEPWTVARFTQKALAIVCLAPLLITVGVLARVGLLTLRDLRSRKSGRGDVSQFSLEGRTTICNLYCFESH